MVYEFFRKFMDTLAPAHSVEADELTAADLEAIIDHLRTFPEDDYVVTRGGRRFAAFVSPSKFAHMAVQIRSQGIGFDHRNIVGYSLQQFEQDLTEILRQFERGLAPPVMIMPADDARDTVAVLISIGGAAGD